MLCKLAPEIIRKFDDSNYLKKFIIKPSCIKIQFNIACIIMQSRTAILEVEALPWWYV